MRQRQRLEYISGVSKSFSSKIFSRHCEIAAMKSLKKIDKLQLFCEKIDQNQGRPIEFLQNNIENLLEYSVKLKKDKDLILTIFTVF